MLALLVVPLCAHGGRGRQWGGRLELWPCLMPATQQWCPVSKADHASSRSIPGHRALTPVPSVCLCAANNVPLPGSALLTPRFSTQPLLALVASCLRLGHQGLIPKEALEVAVLRTPEPAWLRTLETAQAEEALA